MMFSKYICFYGHKYFFVPLKINVYNVQPKEPSAKPQQWNYRWQLTGNTIIVIIPGGAEKNVPNICMRYSPEQSKWISAKAYM